MGNFLQGNIILKIIRKNTRLWNDASVEKCISYIGIGNTKSTKDKIVNHDWYIYTRGESDICNLVPLHLNLNGILSESFWISVFLKNL